MADARPTRRPASGRSVRFVEPPLRPGALRRAYAAFAENRLARFVSRHVNWKVDPVLLRLTGGRVSSTLMVRSGLLETTGARTGRRRRHAVIYFHDEDRIIVIASNAGAASNPGWFHNLCRHPHVVFAGHPMRAAVVVDPEDRRRLEELGDRVFPTFAAFRCRAEAAGRSVPIVQLTPASTTAALAEGRPLSVTTVDSLRTRRGRIDVARSEDPPMLLVVPSGYVGPSLVRRDLEVARRFAQQRTEPWWYVVTPSGVLPHPLNLVFLRSIHRLPNVAGYVVIARHRTLRAMARILGRLGGPDAAFENLEDAIAWMHAQPKHRAVGDQP